MNETIQKIFSITGALLINFLARPAMYWSNIATYMMSYHVHQGNSGRLISPSWFLFIYDLTWTVGAVCAFSMVRCIKPSYLIFVAIVVESSGFFMELIFLHMTWAANEILISLPAGTGLGLFECLVLQYYVVDWTENKGFVTGLIQSSSCAGAAIVNQFITWWVNPQNFPPDLDHGEIVLFSSEEIIKRVPSMFLVIGGANIALQITGFCLLRERHLLHATDTLNENTLTSKDDTIYNTFRCDNENTSNNNENNNCNREPFGSDQQCNNSSMHHENEKNETVSKLLCNRDFQKISFVYFCIQQSFEITTPFFKVYGIVWIENDHFFSTLGTVMVLSAIVGNVIAGICLDKFGIKICLMVICACSSSLLLLMYFLAMLMPGLYFVVTVLSYTFSSLIYPFITASVAISFGNKHLTRNLAVISFMNIFNSLTISVVSEILIDIYGWFSVFAWGSFSCLLAFIFVTLTFSEPKNIK